MCIRDSDCLRKMSNDINELKIKCEEQNVKMDTNFKEIKEQNVNFENSINVRGDELIKRWDEIKNDKVGDVNTSDNQKADGLNANQATVDKVSSCLLYTSRCV